MGLAIHSFLSSIKPKCIHTIPIIDQVVFSIETNNRVICVLFLFETKGNSLAYHLEGVQFVAQAQ